MIFEAAYLKPFLVRTLEPICDAEPGALGDYIIALLKHQVPESEMRTELAAQLDEFLLEESAPFINTLFTALRTKSYIPYTSSGLASSGGTPLAGTTSPDRGRKRAADGDEREDRPSVKGPRLSTEGQFSRYAGNGTGGWGGPQNGIEPGPLHGQMPLNGRQSQPYQPPDEKKGLCRDYHNSGYCARGALCKYSHGEEAVVPGQFFPGAPPFQSMFGSAGNVPYGMLPAAGPAYDPNDARIDIRPPHQRAPLLQRPLDGSSPKALGPGELPVIQNLTPSVPREDQPVPSYFRNGGTLSMNMPVNGMGNHIPMHGNGMMARAPMDVDMNSGMQHPNMNSGPGGGFRGGSMRGRGRGTFGGEVHNFRPERTEKRNDKTLVVEKIPEDKLTLEAVNGWFKRFGTVTNVAIDRASAKALVSFANHEDAHTAWKSEDAVFNNRFVKLFWHRPMEGHGQAGTRLLAASAPVVATMATEPPSTTSSPVPASTPTFPSPAPPSRKPSASAASIALAAKQQKLESQIAEQKTLMTSLSTASSEEKKTIMTRLRKLGEEMKPSPTASGSASPAVVASEEQERERLDKELDVHSATVTGDREESTEDLKAKLARLKAEAASLGLPEAVEPYQGTSHRPYRGRGRGARGGGFYRGSPMRGAARGGAARPSMKLDNRHNMKVDNRTKLNTVEPATKTSTLPATSMAAEKFATAPERAASPVQESSHSSHNVDEEVVASGWGGGDDDEDGMGML